MPCFPIPNLGYQVAGSCAASAVRRPSSPRLRALCIGAALAPPTAGTDVDDGHETEKLGIYIYKYIQIFQYCFSNKEPRNYQSSCSYGATLETMISFVTTGNSEGCCWKAFKKWPQQPKTQLGMDRGMHSPKYAPNCPPILGLYLLEGRHF